MELLTKLEKQALREIKEKDGNGECILDSPFKSQYLSILNITIPYKQLRGILSSLVKKGYIAICQQDEDSVIELQDKAIEYYFPNRLI